MENSKAVIGQTGKGARHSGILDEGRMEPIAALSEVLIDTLKEFSAGNRALNTTTLREALASKEVILSLICSPRNSSTDEKKEELETSKKLDCLPKPEQKPQTIPEREPLSEIRNSFLEILDGIAPMIKGHFEETYSQLYDSVDKCESLIL